MKRINDQRITASHFSAKIILLYAFIITLYSACLLEIANVLIKVQHNGIYMAASILSLITGSSILIALFFDTLNEKHYVKPLLTLSEAARKVAKGDFSIKLDNPRTDGRFDEVSALYEDFNTMIQELNSIEMLKSDFVSNVSHELKSPIAVISNYASLLKNESITAEERTDYINHICISASGLAELIQDILELSRLDNQKITAAPKPFNLSEQLFQTIIGYEDSLDQKNINLILDIPEDVIISSDEGLLRVVWSNLLSNAIKFVNDGGRIEISLSETETGCVFSIRDNGCGIPKESIEHIFDKFYQVDSSHFRKGNGLGLAMVKSILQLLDGSIHVESEPGKGTLFTVTLSNHSPEAVPIP